MTCLFLVKVAAIQIQLVVILVILVTQVEVPC